jgi:hypothetical protein
MGRPLIDLKPAMTFIRSAALALALAATSPLCAAAAPGVLLAPDVAVAGISQAEWSRAWWQWAASFDGSESPISDLVGDKCHLKQSGPVWFLAGTYGSRRAIRKCTVPSGKYLFFPLINYIVVPSGQSPAPNCASVTETAREMTEGATMLVLEFGGVRSSGLERHRQATVECFDLGTRTQPRIKLAPAAANGYYAMLKPLKPGTYELHFGGALPSMMQALSYTLVVE